MSRRDFLKVAGIGSMSSVLLSGCEEGTLRSHLVGTEKSWIERKHLCYATTCGECPAGCGLLVHIMNGRIQGIEGNPAHPVNHGNICGKGQAALQHLFTPGRIQGPLRQSERGSGIFSPMNWGAAIRVIKKTLRQYAPEEIVILLGLFPDHLNDLVQLLSNALGGIRVLRLNSYDEMEGCVTLMDATQKLFGVWRIPHFDLEHSEVIFSFGASFSESWLSPAKQGKYPRQCNRLVHFGACLPDTNGGVAEWHSIQPGSEAILAQALARLVSEYTSSASLPAFATLDLDHASETCGVSVSEMKRLAYLFSRASRKTAIPGSIPLGNSNGLATGQAILALNVAAKNLGKEGGVFLAPESPIYPGLNSRPNTIAEAGALIEDMSRGQVKALLVHGINPLFDLPRSFGFEEALRNVELVISFASSYNETTVHADYLFPDHTPLEGWGYQRANLGGDRMTISGLQPVVLPFLNTHSTVDLILAAAHVVGGEVAASMPFTDEVGFLQKSLAPLMDREGTYMASSPGLFWRFWLKKGGWWEATPRGIPPVVCASFDYPWNLPETASMGEEDRSYYLVPFYHSDNGRKERAHPHDSQQETGMSSHGSSYIHAEMHTETARALGLRNNDMTKISSSAGEIQAVVHQVTTIRPDTIALYGIEKNTALPSISDDRRESPLDLLGKEQNESGDLAFTSTRVNVSHSC
jgi:anaerobic selenocysteine-containing dehydrogenase